MTVKLFWQNAYMKEFNSKVERVEGDVVVLKETAFYPTSGGVLNDTGALTINGKQYRVIDVKKNDDEILHKTDEIAGAKPGDIAHGVIDWSRRYALMRHHTAVHLLDGVVENNYKNGRITGGTVFQDRARLDFEMDDLTRELAQKMIDQTNAVAQEGHRVFAREITQAEALAIPNLSRTEPGRELLKRMSVIRVIEIEGVDVQADGGLHVENTKEIGKMTLAKFENKGRHSKEVKIVLE